VWSVFTVYTYYYSYFRKNVKAAFRRVHRTRVAVNRKTGCHLVPRPTGLRYTLARRVWHTTFGRAWPLGVDGARPPPSSAPIKKETEALRFRKASLVFLNGSIWLL
jgi:hypothetical protein